MLLIISILKKVIMQGNKSYEEKLFYVTFIISGFPVMNIRILLPSTVFKTV